MTDEVIAERRKHIRQLITLANYVGYSQAAIVNHKEDDVALDVAHSLMEDSRAIIEDLAEDILT